ncbi:MAG TPA: D-amino-acid transaminase, partial [Desulfotomaculum sp.]|nr:D-amino-acid transaminase [Desulfotomaculum sp.]
MFWQDHFDRLFASAKTLEIPVSYSVAGLEELVRKIINKNSVRNGSVRLTITAGAAG